MIEIKTFDGFGYNPSFPGHRAVNRQQLQPLARAERGEFYLQLPCTKLQVKLQHNRKCSINMIIQNKPSLIDNWPEKSNHKESQLLYKTVWKSETAQSSSEETSRLSASNVGEQLRVVAAVAVRATDSPAASVRLLVAFSWRRLLQEGSEGGADGATPQRLLHAEVVHHTLLYLLLS